ncbi:MAG: RnfH family protein [Proteobacteria bacterium]|nr:RnfH family protein [Pseudomonadota bacterium]
MANDERLHVTVAYSPAPREVDQVHLRLAPGATVGEAIAASGLVAKYALDLSALAFGVWMRAEPADKPLREADRVEIWRPLRVDPKEARRLRYKQQQIKPGQRPPRPAG